MQSVPFVRAFFKRTWIISGLEAPRITWVATFALAIGTVAVLAYLWWKVRRETKLHAEAAAKIRALSRDHPLRPGEGLPLNAFDEASRLFAPTPSLRSAWQHFLSNRVLRRNAQGQEQVWVAQGAEASFTDAAIIDTRVNRAFFSAIPGIVTGTGLLFTFIAILIALLDVTLTGTKQVEGLDQLIKGLSGKFISSIAALSAATMYLLCEKPLL